MQSMQSSRVPMFIVPLIARSFFKRHFKTEALKNAYLEHSRASALVDNLLSTFLPPLKRFFLT